MMNEPMLGAQFFWMMVMALIVIVPFWRICRKAGFPGWLSVLILIPLVNIAFLYFLAFARWPSHRTFG